MADMLVDSVKLDACLDAEADAIRAKTGGSSDIPFDYANNKGFADAIASIQTGGGSGGQTQLPGLKSMTVAKGSGGTKFEGVFPDCTSFTYADVGAGKLEEIDVQMKSGEIVSIILGTTLNSYDSLRIANFHGARVNPHERQPFWNRPNLEELWVRLDYTNDTNTRFDRVFANTEKLVEIRAVPNTAFYGFPAFPSNYLSDDSLVSIANGLGATSGYTLSLTSASKAKLSSIVGVVTQETDGDSNTYDFFTADASGTVTLMDFITNTKGWTIA